MSETIEFYSVEKPYGEFSNFYEQPITIDGVTYPTSEHYFQSCKFVGSKAADKYAKIVAAVDCPGQAAILARQQIREENGSLWRNELNVVIREYQAKGVKIRPDWEGIKDDIMRRAVMAKFTANPALTELLLGTGNAVLVEHTRNDAYWGDGADGSGKNMLGIILMETREKLRA